MALRRCVGVNWDGDFSEDGRFMLNTSRVRVGRRYETEVLLRERDGQFGPWTIEHGVFNTRREAKAKAERIVSRDPTPGSPDR